MELTKKEREHFETLARALKADGYTGAVVARKMISQHGMDEPAALELVGRLYGKTVNPRSGDTTSAVVMGSVLIGAGLFAIFLMYGVLGIQVHRGSLLLVGVFLSVSGAGARKVFMALVNAGAKEDLRDRRDR